MFTKLGINNDEASFLVALNKAQQEFKESEPEPVYLIGLSQTQLATLKETFEQAKRNCLFNEKDTAKYRELCSLYRYIFIQIASEKKLLNP